MIINSSFSPDFSLPKDSMYVNSALGVRRPKVQLLSVFKGGSGQPNVTTAKTPRYIYRYKTGVSFGEWD